MVREVTCLSPWFGGNRMLASHVGHALRGCSWVGIPFCGGLSEVPHIDARTILCNDLHRHVINTARCVADDKLRREMLRRLDWKLFHPDELAESQELCKFHVPGDYPDVSLAAHYFVCCWMGRGGKAGCESEFNVRPAVRWKSDGGDSMVRYRSALRAMVTFGRVLKRCTFETMDAFDFLARCEDVAENGIYCDSPFYGPGIKYKHNCGETAAQQESWHRRLAIALHRFKLTRVVARFYDCELMRMLYQEPRWQWLELTGRKQTNEEAEECLVVLNPSTTETLF
jgi:DNA adenine methylase